MNLRAQYSTSQEGCHSLSACSPADEPGSTWGVSASNTAITDIHTRAAEVDQKIHLSLVPFKSKMTSLWNVNSQRSNCFIFEYLTLLRELV